MAHYNVVIATPGANFAHDYVRSLMKTAEALQQEGITFKFINGYSSIVSDARELTALDSTDSVYENVPPMMGEHTYDKMFWIDSDMLWTPKYFLDLYHSDKDVISGVYVTAALEPTYYFDNAKDDENKLKFLKRDKPFKVFAVGFGFVCMKSGVMESIDRPWFEFGTYLFETESGKQWRKLVGEDLLFCRKLIDAGYDIWVDPNIRCGHVKSRALGISK
jgi:hypothetical protein